MHCSGAGDVSVVDGFACAIVNCLRHEDCFACIGEAGAEVGAVRRDGGGGGWRAPPWPEAHILSILCEFRNILGDILDILGDTMRNFGDVLNILGDILSILVDSLNFSVTFGTSSVAF